VKSQALLFAALAVSGAASLPIAAVDVTASVPVAALVGANTNLGVALLRQIDVRDDNVLFSPFSISNALAMVAAGARGPTERELLEVLGPGLKGPELAAAFEELNARVKAAPAAEAILTLANSLWYQEGFPMNDAFTGILRQDFQARFAPVDFLRAAPAACLAINQWVDEATGHRIPVLVSPAMVGPRTRLLLANAVYFKSRWANEFKRAGTFPRLFFTKPDNPEHVPTMHLTTEFRTLDLEGLRILGLPYLDDRLSMAILLPNAIDGLPGLESRLSGSDLSAWLRKLDEARARETSVSLPRFRMESSFELAGTLSKLGIATLFQPEAADLSGIDGKRDLWVSNVVHKALIETNEEGTVAAASTGVVLTTFAVHMGPDPVEFNANHPFLFVIREKSTGVILFMGRVMNPR